MKKLSLCIGCIQQVSHAAVHIIVIQDFGNRPMRLENGTLLFADLFAECGNKKVKYDVSGLIGGNMEAFIDMVTQLEQKGRYEIILDNYRVDPVTTHLYRGTNYCYAHLLEETYKTSNH